eukprot:34257_1
MSYIPLSLLLFESTLSQLSQFTKYQQYGALFDSYGFGSYSCIDNIDCILNCYGYWACSGFDWIGPKNAKFIINCNANYNGTNNFGSGGCANLNVYAENSSELHINVYNNDDELQNGMIYTPLNSNINTFIKCGIIGPYNANSVTSSCGSNNIYSKHGWQTVEWTYSGTASWSLQYGQYNNMHCGTNYVSSCSGSTVDGFFYRCTNTQSVCDYSRKNQTRSQIDLYIYEVTTTAIPWNLGNYQCNLEFGTQIASIHSSDEWTVAIAAQSESGKDYIWIGLQKTGVNDTWQWTDSSAFDYGINEYAHPWYDADGPGFNFASCPDGNCCVTTTSLDMGIGYWVSSYHPGGCGDTRSALCHKSNVYISSNPPTTNSIANTFSSLDIEATESTDTNECPIGCLLYYIDACNSCWCNGAGGFNSCSNRQCNDTSISNGYCVECIQQEQICDDGYVVERSLALYCDFPQCPDESVDIHTDGSRYCAIPCNKLIFVMVLSFIVQLF